MSRTVLIVEDEIDGQEVIAALLNFVDIQSYKVGSAEEALSHLEQSADYDAIIIDLALPNMDGFELMRVIRNDAELAELVCIAVTAYHNSQVRHEAIEQGFDAYFPKPLDEMTFPQDVSEVLG